MMFDLASGVAVMRVLVCVEFTDLPLLVQYRRIQEVVSRCAIANHSVCAGEFILRQVETARKRQCKLI